MTFYSLSTLERTLNFASPSWRKIVRVDTPLNCTGSVNYLQSFAPQRFCASGNPKYFSDATWLAYFGRWSTLASVSSIQFIGKHDKLTCHLHVMDCGWFWPNVNIVVYYLQRRYPCNETKYCVLLQNRYQKDSHSARELVTLRGATYNFRLGTDKSCIEFSSASWVASFTCCCCSCLNYVSAPCIVRNRLQYRCIVDLLSRQHILANVLRCN